MCRGALTADRGLLSVFVKHHTAEWGAVRRTHHTDGAHPTQKQNSGRKSCDRPVHYPQVSPLRNVLSPACRLLLVCVLIFQKFQSDFFLSNHDFSQLVGMNLRELNGLESFTLAVLDYRLLITREEFEFYDNQISFSFFEAGLHYLEAKRSGLNQSSALLRRDNELNQPNEESMVAQHDDASMHCSEGMEDYNSSREVSLDLPVILPVAKMVMGGAGSARNSKKV